MKINEAKEQIKRSVAAYLTKNEHGEYVIPIKEQRPVFVMGAPGIGKTDIMKQISEELKIGMVSYSMTHHTRQSALGLPQIIERTYNGKSYKVTEYTMSEIISSIYSVVENYGVKEGILFLDEINCVSETLAPSMLQFLQYKTFGEHRIPDGWIVVTAGNPPEYNNSVREFDIVTWDRLKRIDVEPDFEIWLEHAKATDVHTSIISYLFLKPVNFYVEEEKTVDGKSFVTARGWVDLSQMIKLYEQKGFPVDFDLISQYLQNREVSKEFASYYDLFIKYRSEFEIDEILAGKQSSEIEKRANEAPFDERLALINLLIDALSKGMREVNQNGRLGIEFAKEAMLLKNVKSVDDISKHVKTLEENLSNKRKANTIKQEDVIIALNVNVAFEEMIKHFSEKENKVNVQEYCTKFFKDHKEKLKKDAVLRNKEATNILTFASKAFGTSDQSFTLIMAELTTNLVCAKFLSDHGNEAYYNYNKNLLVHEIEKELLLEIDDLGDLWSKMEEDEKGKKGKKGKKKTK